MIAPDLRHLRSSLRGACGALEARPTRSSIPTSWLETGNTSICLLYSETCESIMLQQCSARTCLPPRYYGHDRLDPKLQSSIRSFASPFEATGGLLSTAAEWVRILDYFGTI